MYISDTIAAISTALGEGAIGIVRMSGPEAIDWVSQVFKGKDLNQVASHTIHYGHLCNQEGQVIDEVMVTILRGPKTYTREDIVEINCHGGMMAVQSILDVCLSLGARLAQPGEFTKRAFLNGRIDLSQAEALMDVIQAKTSQAMEASMNQLQGSLSTKISALRQEMLETLAQVEVTIDYPEYDDVDDLSNDQLSQTALTVKEQVQAILQEAQGGRLFREGIQTAIIGRPNVGKSSLLNRLTGSDKAIVTEIEGTTRDSIEEYINVKGVPLHLIDTAGIRETDEVVEQIGVTKSRQIMAKADLIILVLNQSEPLTDTDKELLEMTKDQKRLIVLNKEDLPCQMDLDQLSKLATKDEWIVLSMLADQNLQALEDRIADLFYQGGLNMKDVNYLLNSRHTQLLKQTIQALDEVIQASQAGLPVDLIQIDYVRAWDFLGEITGESVQDELLDKLFSQFCLGK